MATRWDTFPIKLEGGLTTNLGRLEQGIKAPGSATVLQNFETDVEGGYTRVLGFGKFSTTAVTGTGPIRGVLAVSATETLAERAGEFLYSSGGAWTSKLTLTNTGIFKVNFSEFNFTGVTKFIATDGVNGPAFFDSVTKTMTYMAAPPADIVGASRSQVFKSHLFFAKGTLLSWAAPFTENDFAPANGAGIININDGITGLTVFRDQLIIFCLNSIYRLSGSSLADFQLSPITNNTGCLSGDTVQEVGGDIMYLGPDGIRYLSASERNNDFGLTRASDKIQKQVLDVVRTNSSFSSITLAAKNQYRFFPYNSGTTSATTKSFLATKFSNQTVEDISWSTLKGFKVFSVSKCQTVSGEFIVFSSDTDYIYKMEFGNSLDGENIDAIFETPYMPITDPKLRKTIYKHTVYTRSSGTLSLIGKLQFDYTRPDASPSSTFEISSGASVVTYGSGVYGVDVYGSRGYEEYYNNVIGSGFTISLQYRDTSTSAPFNLNFVVLEFRQNERR